MATSTSTHPPVSISEKASSTSGSQPKGATDMVLDHEYDGIREYDNPLPRWWVLIFWASFWFSLAYVLVYHVFDRGMSITAAYNQEVKIVAAERARAALNEAVSEESLEKLAANPTVIVGGKAIFAERCTPCHGANAQGLIGPNLTDGFWIHGKGKLLDIYDTINGGVLAKGMPAWGQQLKPDDVRKVAAFVGSLRGTNVPGKGPEGNPSE